MSKKKSAKRDREEQLRRRLDQAQEALQHAQARRSVAMTKGERDVEAARARAASRVERATHRVERKAAQVARAEAQLAAQRTPSLKQRSTTQLFVSPQETVSTSIEGAPQTPEAVAESLARVEAGRPTPSLVLDTATGPSNNHVEEIAAPTEMDESEAR